MVNLHKELVVVANLRLLVNKVREAGSIGCGERVVGEHLLGHGINVRNPVAWNRIPNENRLPRFATATRAGKERFRARIEKLAAVKVKVGRSSASAEVDGSASQDITEITIELLGSWNMARQRQALLLAQGFVVTKYESLILMNGTTHGKAKLVADEFGFVGGKEVARIESTVSQRTHNPFHGCRSYPIW